MRKIHSRSMLSIPSSAQAALVAGARDPEPVRGLTHGFYKYPARFSPAFARAAIEAFTQPGEMVLDNHVGGGTTLVEALALGRNSVGVDISALAEFVSKVKTTVLAEKELENLEKWSKRIPDIVHVRKASIHLASYAELGYYKHLDHRNRWRLRKAIEQGLGSAIRLGSERLESFGRCVILRTAQWALDSRRKLPTLDEFREMLAGNARQMIVSARDLGAAVKNHPTPPAVRVINRSAAGLEQDECFSNLAAPKLVVTSPPYPGVHVLYHRWQVDGRKEAPVPFMIANKLDGSGSSFYTMGDRKYPGLKTYFDRIRATMSSVAALADEHTVVVQMVAFSDPSWQVKQYLRTMEEAGLQEVFLSTLCNEHDGRLWRTVPNRRWYSDQRGETPGSREVVLIHRKQGCAIRQPHRQSPRDVRSRP